MKRTISMFALNIIFILFVGCGSSMEEDAVKMAELQCKNMQIIMGGAVEALSNRKDSSDVLEHQEKLKEFSLEMSEKYDGFEERHKFAEMAQAKLIKICS